MCSAKPALHRVASRCLHGFVERVATDLSLPTVCLASLEHEQAITAHLSDPSTNLTDDDLKRLTAAIKKAKEKGL